MVTMRADGNIVAVSAPYNAEFVTAAKALKGRWDPDKKIWVFAAEQREAVARLIAEHYGIDPTGENRTVDLDVYLKDGEIPLRELTVAGRTLLIRWEKYEYVKPGRDVKIAGGKFEGKGGSVRRPQIGPVQGVRLLVRNWPESAIAMLENSEYVAKVVRRQI
jgi:hypothetical protein